MACNECGCPTNRRVCRDCELANYWEQVARGEAENPMVDYDSGGDEDG